MTGAIPLKQELVDESVRLVAAAVPELPISGVFAAVVQATGHARPLRELRDHLASHPFALTSGSADQVPPSVVRLFKHLAAQGVTSVKMPACFHCGRTDRNLPRRVAGGRLCWTCAQNANAQPCADCGQNRPVHIRADRGPLCEHCAGRPERVCGICGKTKRVGRRANDASPDICQECARVEIGSCEVCGLVKQCRRRRDGRRLCSRCIFLERSSEETCCRCGKLRRIAVRWPAGPICHGCYERSVGGPQPCSDCGRRAVLTGTNEAGKAICATCAGSPRTYDCPVCGQACRPYAGGRCARVVLINRIDRLFKVAENPRYQLLQNAFANTDDPRGTIRWLAGQGGAALADLVATGQPLTHADVDAIPSSPAVGRFLRALLVTTEVLPDRDDYLERVTVWIDRTMAGRPAHHTNVLRPYALWDVMARARRRQSRHGRPSTSATGGYLRQKIRVAADLLNWIDGRDSTLDQLTQADLEFYIVDDGGKPLRLRGFITWLRRHHLIGDVRLPRPTRVAQPNPIPEHELWLNLRRCLNADEQMPLRIRVVAALLLLYGNPVTRTVALTSSDIRQDGDRYYLTLAKHPLLLPPVLAGMVNQLRDQARSDSVVGRSVAATTWLFPGRHPGSHRDGIGLTATVASHGIDVRPTRTAALMSLAGQLPSAVLGPLLGLHPHTAVKWSDLVKRDWTAYLAIRQREGQLAVADEALAQAVRRP